MPIAMEINNESISSALPWAERNLIKPSPIITTATLLIVWVVSLAIKILRKEKAIVTTTGIKQIVIKKPLEVRNLIDNINDDINPHTNEIPINIKIVKIDISLESNVSNIT